jgi:hypothetical protein
MTSLFLPDSMPVPAGTVTVHSVEGVIASLPVRWERVDSELRNKERVTLPTITRSLTLTHTSVRRTDGTELNMILAVPIKTEPGATVGFNRHALRIQLNDHLYAFPGTELEDEEDDDDWDDDDPDDGEEMPLAAAPIDEASWAPIAAIYKETALRSGRTTRLLGEAVRRAIEGKGVHFVVSNRMMQSEAFHLLGKHHRETTRASLGFEAHALKGPGFVRIITMNDSERLRGPTRADVIVDHAVVEHYGMPSIPKANVGSDYRFPVVAGIEYGQSPSAYAQKLEKLREGGAGLGGGAAQLGGVRGALATGPVINEAPFIEALEKHMAEHCKAFSGSNSVARGEADLPAHFQELGRRMAKHVKLGEPPGLTLAELHKLDVERALSAMKS